MCPAAINVYLEQLAHSLGEPVSSQRTLSSAYQGSAWLTALLVTEAIVAALFLLLLLGRGSRVQLSAILWLLCPQGFSRQDAGVGCHALLQGSSRLRD